MLKSALIDFYSDKDITVAKACLLNDLHSMNLTEKTPHLPTRREGDNRLVREVDDMIAVFTFLDERKLLDNLPKYVADGPDNMPTTRLYEGDLKVFMEQLVRMDEKMAALSSTLAIVVHDVRVCNQSPRQPRPGVHRLSISRLQYDVSTTRQLTSHSALSSRQPRRLVGFPVAAH